MNRWILRFVLMTGLLTSAAEWTARAEPRCTPGLAPSALSLQDTGLDQNRVACGVDGVGVGTRGQATIDTPNFYGTLGASLFADYRWLHETGFEFSLGARIVDYRFAQSAVFTDDDVALGPVSVGILRPHRTSLWGYPVVSAQALRFELPFTNTSDQSLTIAASPSLLGTMMLSDRLHLHAHGAALLWSALPESGPDSRAALLVSSDVALALFPSMAVTAGAEAQGGWYGVGLDHLLARVGVRAVIGGESAIELSAASAVVGSERIDLVFWLGYSSIATGDAVRKKSRLQEWAD